MLVFLGFTALGFLNFEYRYLDDLEKLFEAGAEVNPDVLLKIGIIQAGKDGVKVLGFGTLSKKLKVSAHRFSKAAEAAIGAAKGEIIKL